MLQISNQPATILHQAYELLVKMQKLHFDPMEEVSIHKVDCHKTTNIDTLGNFVLGLL